MATCIKCGTQVGEVKGTTICLDCVDILIKSKTPEELITLAKIGMDAVIDEVTGYEKIRPKDDLKKRHQKYADDGIVHL